MDYLYNNRMHFGHFVGTAALPLPIHTPIIGITTSKSCSFIHCIGTLCQHMPTPDGKTLRIH